ncbi:MAG: ATP-binding cassette domain-containing protein [Collinsella intestinalis]
MTSSRVGAPLIEARNITKHYDGFTLQGVSLTVEPGQIVGFIGQNGAGKSTTIKALLGIIGVDAGDARILGVDARAVRCRRRGEEGRVGVVFDTVSMPPHIKIAEVGKLMSAYQTWDARVFKISSSVQARFEEGD